MALVVTGSAGHLGDAIVRTLRARGEPVIGVDLVASPTTDAVGSILDRGFVDRVMLGASSVIHAATLHKPHVASRSRQAFVDTNVTGTLTLLESATARHVRSFVFTSTTSTFGDALVPPPGAPAAWITEEVPPVPKNIYGVTKTAAEDLCRLFSRNERLPVVVLRTSRFFPEADDVADPSWDQDNLKVNELLSRRADLADLVDVHLLAIERAPALGFARYVASATTPFLPEDAAGLRVDAAAVLARRVRDWPEVYARRGWRMTPVLDRIYDNGLARRELGWRPVVDFAAAVARLAAGEDWRSALAREVGAKGYAGSSAAYRPPDPA